MSFERIPLADIDKLPPAQQQHARQCKELGEKLVGVINPAGMPSTVVLDSLINVYLTAATHPGREL